jgi:uncharacterized protein YdaU (DUF1376 family)
MSKADIWMPLYIGDYMGDTMHLSTEQHGAYLLLTFAYWRNGGPIPDDPDYLAGVSKLSTDAWQRHSRRIAEFFKVENGFWRHERIEIELAKAKRQKEAKSNAGKVGAAAKYGRRIADAQQTDAAAIADGWRTDSPSPSPSPLAYRESVDRPSEAEVKAYADRIGLAEWRALDWYQEMEACGWIDHNSRPVMKWQPLLTRVKTKWEADGRPTTPPVNRAYAQKTGAPFAPSIAQQIAATKDLLAGVEKRLKAIVVPSGPLYAEDREQKLKERAPLISERAQLQDKLNELQRKQLEAV